MARPTVITNERILTAARAVFLEHGIAGKTSEVARRAGVAEGTVFNRFKSKGDLFKAAMRSEMEEPAFLRILDMWNGRGDFREKLIEFSTSAIQFYRQVMPLIMMSSSNPGPGGVPEFVGGPKPPRAAILKTLANFFMGELVVGGLAWGASGMAAFTDAEAIARVYLGSLENHVFLEVLAGGSAPGPSGDANFLEGLVEVLWRGLAPRPR